MNKPFAIGEILQVKRTANLSNQNRNYYLVIAATTAEQPLKIQQINSSAKYKAGWAFIPSHPEEDLERTTLQIKQLIGEEVVVHEQLHFEYVIGEVAKAEQPAADLQFIEVEGGWQSTQEVYFSADGTYMIKSPLFLETPKFDEN